MPLLAESSKGDLPLCLGFLYACESLRKLRKGLVKASTCAIFSISYLFKNTQVGLGRIALHGAALRLVRGWDGKWWEGGGKRRYSTGYVR